MTEDQKNEIVRYYYHMKDLHEVSDKHSHAESYYEGEVGGIVGTLNKLGIIIEGVNA